MMRNFVHPESKVPLERDAHGNLFCMADNKRSVYECHDGCCDFVTPGSKVRQTRVAYDEEYRRAHTPFLTEAEVTEPWRDETEPWRKTMLDTLGPLSGRRVLLVGNGASYREFYFLLLGAEVVFTDLSLVAAKEAQTQFRQSELFQKYQDAIEFHAVDAMRLPFPDQSFDVIYGKKFAGFLPSLSDFLSETRRCLKPGGLCRFGDDAVSPAWEAVRHAVVLPVKALRKSRTSLDTLRSASAFGISQESLTPFVGPSGFSRIVFIREFFFLRVAQLFCGKLFHWNPKKLRYARPVYLICKWVDNHLVGAAWMRRNSLYLTWGFDK